MKFRNFLIVLLVLLMAFALASCNDEPEKGKKNDTPEPAEVYRLISTKNRSDGWYSLDKFVFMLDKVPGFSVKAGDVLSFSFRSNRDIPEFSLRQTANPEGDICWIYEDTSDAFTTFEVGEDGWTKVTYKFETTVFQKDNDIPREEWETMTVNYGKNGTNDVRLDFRGVFFEGDVLDIKDFRINNKAIVVTPEVVAKYVMPTLETNPTTDLPVKTPSVGYVVGPTSSSNVPTFEQVALGSTINPTLAKEGHTYELYTNAKVQDETTLFDRTTPITNDIILYIKWTPIPQDVTYHYNNGDADGSFTVDYGTVLEAPADPVSANEDEVFAGWFTDQELSKPYDFAEPVKSALDLYAKYTIPRTVKFVTNCDTEVPDKTVATGNPVELPELTKGTDIFGGWFLESTFDNEYKKGDAVNANITLYAKWFASADITLNLGIDGFTADPIRVKCDFPMDKPEAPVIPGFFFDDWYDDDALTVKHDFTANVAGAFTLYAKYEAGTLYHMVSRHDNAESVYDYDKFTIQYADGKANTGDVLSFRYRSTTEFTFFSIRGDNKWVYENSSSTRGMTTYETKADGWTYVTYKFAEKNTSGGTNGANLWWRLDFGSRTIVKGDVLEVQGLAINGTPLTVAAGNLTKYVNPTLEVIPSAYDWDKTATNLTLTYNTGDASAIPSDTVAFGALAQKPADPEKEGFVLEGWYADEGFTIPFVFPHVIVRNTTAYAKMVEPRPVTFVTGEGSAVAPITVARGTAVEKPKDPTRDGYFFDGWYLTDPAELYDFSTLVDENITLNAKWTAKKTVTFNSKGGSAVEAQVVREGSKATKPATDPENEPLMFAGWYVDEEYSAAYDFSTVVSADITLYAKWVEARTITFDYNYAGAPANKEVKFAYEGKATAPVAGNPGYYLDGWYTAQGDKVDFETYTVTADETLTAHWTAPTTYYKLTATAAQKRASLRYSSTYVNPKKGDVIAFKFRVPEGKAFDRLYLRNYAGDSSTKIANGEEGSLAAVATVTGPDKDGWYTFTVTFDKLQDGKDATYPFAGFLLEPIYYEKFAIGDEIDILGFSYNGKELVITDDYHHGVRKNDGDASSDIKPTLTVHYVANDAIVE